MAQNYSKQDTTKRRSDTRTEALTAQSFTGESRFRTLLNTQKLTNAGASAWKNLKSSLNPQQYLLRYKLTKGIKAR